MPSYHPTSYLADYLHYNRGNECQEGYHVWAGIFAAGTMLCRRVWIPFEYFDIYPNLYITLVGKQGNRKSTAKDIARDVIAQVYPRLMLSASVMSREQICNLLGKDEAIRTYKDHNGVVIEHRPFTMLINELKNFISIDPQKMVDFLTDIYDRKLFDVGTKNKGSDYIPNPCINLLACETTSWITDRMKEGLITGGFSRRMIYVHEYGERQRIPFPSVPPGGLEAWNRVKETLKRMQSYCGPFSWTEEAREWYASWYTNLRPGSTPIVSDFHESKHIQMLKIAMILTLADTGELVLTRPGLEVAAAIIDAIQPGMKEIGLTVGRNSLIGPTTDAMHTIRGNVYSYRGASIPGMMLESALRTRMFTHMNALEIDNTLNHLIQTEQLSRCKLQVSPGVEKTFLVMPDVLAQLQAARSAGTAVLDSVSHQPSSPPAAASASDTAASSGPPT